MAEHRVTYRRDAKGLWSASVSGFKRCRGQGKTLREARRMLRQALARRVEEPYAIDFVEDVRLPPPARTQLLRHWAARRRLEGEQKRADAAAATALHALVALRIGLKDAADLLGIPPLKLQKLKALGPERER